MSLPKCTYEFIKKQKIDTADLCNKVAHGFCSHHGHYFNLFHLHYCTLKGSKPLFLVVISALACAVLLAMNFVRKSYFVKPVLKMRKKLGLTSTLAEAVLIPIAFGIGPLFMRIQAGYQDITPSMNFGASLGTMFFILTLVIGSASIWVRRSSPVRMKPFFVNLVFSVAGLVVYCGIGLTDEVATLDGVTLIILWLMYLVVIMIVDSGETEGKKETYLL